MIRTVRHIMIWAALALSLVSGVYFSWLLFDVYRENKLIEQLLSGVDIDINKVVTGHPELRLVRAHYLKQKRQYDEAFSALSLIMDKGDWQFQTKVRYNLGNQYLEQAVEQVETMNMNEALPLAGLAKQAYRQALQIDSRNWDAKYNLEVAMRLLPEMDRINTPEDAVNNQKTQLWTTVPGFPRGLP